VDYVVIYFDRITTERPKMDEYERRREQTRQAQARYRKVHAKRLRAARRIARILSRQTAYASDFKELADAIRVMNGKEYARALGRELAKRRFG
jgi:hypothetical protein